MIKTDSDDKEIYFCYIRLGDIPSTGKSLIHRGDDIIGEEKGVSVWECIYINNQYRLLLPNPLNESAYDDIGDLLHPYYYIDKPVYKVDGDVVGYGADGEPLLTNIRSVIKLSDKIDDVFKNECRTTNQESSIYVTKSVDK